MRPAVDRFTIRWDKSWGGYRVSCPEISTDGERVEVVWAPAHDAVRDALAELVRLKDGPRDDAYRAEKDAAWEAARAALASRDSQAPKEDTNV